MKEVCRNKGVDLDIDYLLEVDDKRRELIQKSEKLRSLQKKFGLKNKEKALKNKKELKEVLDELSKISEEYQELMFLVPNIYHSNASVGSEDIEVYKWGEPKRFDFKIKDHIELGKELDIIDTEQGVYISGFRGYYLKKAGAILHYALLWYSLNKMIEKGFTPMVVPTIVKKEALYGSGHFPFGKEDVFQIANPGKLADGSNLIRDKEKKYLTGTSEPSLLAYYMDKTLKEEDLPIKITALAPAYRSEIGSYGKDTKGLFRLSEFTKVEQLVICKADIEESDKWLEKMSLYSQEILQELELPYRVIDASARNMGAGKYKMYDIETWMPSRGNYGETHSNSNLTDWQTRRINLKYIDKEGNKKYCYALNNTVIASPRILIAILENYQQADGSVKIPKVLQKYLNLKVIKKNGI